jgi:hypothetical protein
MVEGLSAVFNCEAQAKWYFGLRESERTTRLKHLSLKIHLIAGGVSLFQKQREAPIVARSESYHQSGRLFVRVQTSK